jgi:AraC-like DNA-binding protein
VYSRVGDDFAGTLRADLVGELRILTITADAQTVIRTPRIQSQGDEASFYKFIFHEAGCSRLSQDDRSVVLDEPALVVYDTTRAYRLEFDSPYLQHVLMVPRVALGVSSSSVANLTATGISVEAGAARVLRRLVVSLDEDITALSEHSRLALSETLIELAQTVLLDMTADHLEDPDAAAYAEVLTFVEHHLGDDHLTPQTIAAAHFMSLRKLQGLFQARGESPSSWIRKRRLENCRRDLLRDPLVPIASVAARWGFLEVKTFSRAFKRAFAVSPAEFRRTLEAGQRVAVHNVDERVQPRCE